MNNIEREKLSGFVICCNEEKNIRRCLESIKWCDEIIVVDSGSTDKTLDICREYTDNIIQREWPGNLEQKRFALGQCKNEWILNIDADEEVSEKLQTEIQTVLENSSNSEINGYQLLRVVYYFDKWWRKGGWYPEYRLRLCRRSKTSWGGNTPHEKALVDGKTTRLCGELHHFTYENLAGQINSLNKLSSAAAEDLHKRGKRVRLIDLIFRPKVRFLKFYIIKKGYREGRSGFIVACIEAYDVFLKYAKLWERQSKHNQSKKIS